MNAYEPGSRRPIAGVFRRTADGAVRVCVRLGVHPDVVSYASVVAAAGAGVCFWQAGRWPVLLLVGPVLCIVRLWFNMLDGMVALASGKASARGEIVNELPDRVSDILIFVGVALGGMANPHFGYWAAIMAVMTAYVGTLGQAVAGRRRFEGVMSKQYRMAVLSVGAVAAYLFRGGGAYGLSTLDWTCAAIIVGCVQTIWVRLVGMLRELRVTGGGR